MANGSKPSGKAKPSNYPYGQSGGTEMTGDKGTKSTSREFNRGPGKGVGGRIKGLTRMIGK
jgi:hypothetical protein